MPRSWAIMFLGDHTRPGLGGIALIGFSLAVVCAVALARFGRRTSGGSRQRSAGSCSRRRATPARTPRRDRG